MERVVVDTDVVSFHVKNDTRFAGYALELDGKQLIISFMTIAELFLWQELRNWGTRRRQLFLDELNQRYILYPVDRELCRLWAQLKSHAKNQGRVLETADAWIAATAMHLDVPLVTHNAKDFQFLTRLQVISFASQ